MYVMYTLSNVYNEIYFITTLRAGKNSIILILGSSAFVLARNFALSALYWLVPGMDSRVCL